MNLTKLFEMQKELDAKIIREKKLDDMDRLPYLILALQVELGECANEWRGFKYWSKDQKPRTDAPRYPNDRDCMQRKNPLLEEYVDCLHFILSIGLELEADEWDLERFLVPFKPYNDQDGITDHFIDVIGYINGFRNLKGTDSEYDAYKCTLEIFMGLGEMLGFTLEQIEQAYMDKNVINHERQINGY